MTAPEPTPYTPSDGSLARALFDADVDATDPEVADRMWSRLAMAHSSWHEQADRLAPWLAAHDARVRAEAVLDYMRTKETPRVEITPLAGPARPGPMSTLHDRITALADEWAGIDPGDARHTHFARGRLHERREAGKALRAVLAETTTTQPGCGWCDDGRDVTHPNCDHAAAQPVEPRLLWLDRAAPTPWKVRVVTDGLPSNGPGGHVVVDANGLALVQTDYDEHGYNLAHLIAQAPDLYRARVALPVEPEPDERDALASALHAFGDGLFADEHRVPWAQVSHAARRYRLAQADAVLAAGFRRSRPEAT